MKRHERCRIGGSFGAGEIPLLSSFLYLFDDAEAGSRSGSLGRVASASGVGRTLRCRAPPEAVAWRVRSASKTVSGGEFGWGGTSVKG